MYASDIILHCYCCLSLSCPYQQGEEYLDQMKKLEEAQAATQASIKEKKSKKQSQVSLVLQGNR